LSRQAGFGIFLKQAMAGGKNTVFRKSISIDELPEIFILNQEKYPGNSGR